MRINSYFFDKRNDTQTIFGKSEVFIIIGTKS